MKIIKYLWKSKLPLTVLLCFFALPAKTNIFVKSPDEVIFNCIEDEPSKYFCTNVPVVNPTIILQVSRFERKKISRHVNAFRIMPSLTNLTQQTIRSAQIKLTFWEKSQLSKSDLQNIQSYVILSLYILIPPRRSLDYTEMKIDSINLQFY